MASEIPQHDPQSLAFEGLTLDLERQEVSVDGRAVELSRLLFDVLSYIAQCAPRVVTRDELLEAYWPDNPSDEALSRCVSTLRKRLDDTDEQPRFIETRRGFGYCFVAEPLPTPAHEPVPEQQPPQQPTAWLPGFSRRTGLLAILLITLVLAALGHRNIGQKQAADSAPAAGQGVQAAASALPPKAQNHWLQARRLWRQRNQPALRQAIEQYDVVLRLVPDYVPALVGRAESRLLLPLYGGVAAAEIAPPVKADLTRAMELAPNNARAMAVSAQAAVQFDWAWARANAQMNRAVELAPSDATIAQWAGEMACHQRRFERCAELLARARSLGPASPVQCMLRGSPAFFGGDYDKAFEEFSYCLRIYPDFAFLRYSVGLALSAGNDWRSALQRFTAVEAELGLEIVGGAMAYAHGRLGERAQAVALIERLKALSETKYVPPTKFAAAHLGLGDVETAMQWLEQARDFGDDRLIYAAVDPQWLLLRGNPRFNRLLASVGLPIPDSE